MTRLISTLLFGALAYSVCGCNHLPKPQPGQAFLFVGGETGEALKKIVGHQAITPGRYAVLVFGKPQDLTPYLECHEKFHAVEQAAAYENDLYYLADYGAKAVETLLIHAPGHLVPIVIDILSGRMKIADLGREEGEMLLRITYQNHPMELAANKACEHLKEP